MKKKYALLIFLTVIFNCVHASSIIKEVNKNTVPKTTVCFTENKGQVSDQNYEPRPDVLFSGTDGKLTYHLKNNGISYQLSRVDSWKKEERNSSPLIGMDDKRIPDQTTIYRLDINWLNTNSNALILKGRSLTGYDNYYLANCPDGVTHVKSYDGITYQELYNGINLKWYEKEGHLKYDYIVAANADYKKIQLELKGAESISMNGKGELIIKTPLGSIIEQTPFVEQNGKQLPAKWIVKNNILSFEIKNINPAQLFTIDPLVRAWGTYYYGNDATTGYACTTDTLGNSYLTGLTGSTINMATSGSNQLTNGGGAFDAFLVKFNSSGVRQWGTYYGGTAEDRGNSCVTDISGNIYMAGETRSSTTTAIANVGSHQPNFGGAIDAFLVKFDSSGVRKWGTYYGGPFSDIGWSCSSDTSGNIYLTGMAYSLVAITTPGSYQPTMMANGDAFLVKFDSLGVRQWGTYYGGSGGDVGFECSNDRYNNVYLAGWTNSTAAIATAGSYQTIFGGGDDNFLVKFNSNGIPQWGTYCGGNGNEGPFDLSCTNDIFGNVFIAGYTQSSNGIMSPGAFQTTFTGTISAYLMKFNSNGVLQWGTYYNGEGITTGRHCITDPFGNIYLSGETNSTLNIVTSDGYQPFYGGGPYDTYLVKFDSAGVRKWGTYYGGTGSDAQGCSAIDVSGSLYLGGQTTSTTNIATSGSHQPTYGVGGDAFLVKFNPGCMITTNISDHNNVSCFGGNNGNVTIAPNAGTSPYTYLWSNTKTTAGISNLIAGNYNVTVTDANGCTEIISTNINEPTLLGTTITATNILCNGTSTGLATANTSGGTSPYHYNWSNGQSNLTISGLTVGSYTVTITDANNCSASNTITITQPAVLTITITTTIGCGANNASATAGPLGGTPSYFYQWSNGTSTSVNNNLSTGIYTVTITDTNNCTAKQTVNIVVFGTTLTATVSNDITIASGTTTILSAWGGVTYDWIPSAGLNCTTCQNPIVNPLLTTVYCVIVSDSNGCKDSVCVTVNVDIHCEPFIPNAFSPNGDNKNDIECLYSLSCYTNIEFNIFNRWGDLVFATNDPKQCWDGTYKGFKLKTDIFVYYLKATTLNGEEVIKKGNISLIK